MPPQIADIEPTVFPAGDTVKWTKHLPDYPASDGWVLTYAFRGEKGGEGRLDLTAVGSGEDYSITVPGVSSNLMRPGTWRWDAFVTLAGERTRISSGSTRVEPNLSVTNFSTDLRSTKKIAYDNAREAMETFAKAKMVILNGRTYTARDYDDLKKYVDDCTTAWILEQQSIVNPTVNPRKIWGLFNRDR